MVEIVLIGYGSVGRRHATVAHENGHDIVILDQNPDARAEAAETYPDATVLSDMSALEESRAGLEDAVGIIATWATSHGDYFHELADLGVRRILCEKPLSNSLASAQSMCERAEQEDVRLLVNHRFRYSDEIGAIRSWEDEYDLGPPVRFLSIGGALGLINNGVHFKDLAFGVFDSRPDQVVSSARSQRINPRSDDLDYYGGTTVLGFEDEREAVFSYTNGSSLAHTMRIDYRDALVEFDGEYNVSIHRRDPEAVEEYPSITRYGPASEEVYSASNPFPENPLYTFERVHDDLLSDRPPESPGTLGQDVLQACIGSLIAAAEGKRVSLPVSPESKYWEHEWSYN